MDQRPFHDILSDIVGADKCYFDPPASMQMKYPCILYSYSNDIDRYANNKRYMSSRRYVVTVIDEDPDSKIPDMVKNIPYCQSDRNFTMDGLRHFVFIVYHNGPRVNGG